MQDNLKESSSSIKLTSSEDKFEVTQYKLDAGNGAKLVEFVESGNKHAILCGWNSPLYLLRINEEKGQILQKAIRKRKRDSMF